MAAWTIGGLVARKIIAKAGLFAVILKFLAPVWKFLLLGILPVVAWFKRKFSQKQTAELQPIPVEFGRSYRKRYSSISKL